MKGEYLEGKPLTDIKVKGTLFKRKRGSKYCYRLCLPAGNISSKDGLESIERYLKARPSVLRRLTCNNTDHFTLADCIKGSEKVEIETLKPVGNYAIKPAKRIKEPSPVPDKCYSPDYHKVYQRLSEHRQYVIDTLEKGLNR